MLMVVEIVFFGREWEKSVKWNNMGNNRFVLRV